MIGIVPNPNKQQMWAMGLACGFLIFFIFLMILAIAHHNGNTYAKDIVSLAHLHGDQCELPIDRGWIVELQNTLSNVGYAVAGALILLRVQTWAGHLFGINLLLLSIASGWYHATLDGGWPQRLDVGWVYAVLLSLSAYAAYVHVQTGNPLQLSGGYPWIFGWRPYVSGRGIWIICGLALIVLAVVCELAFPKAKFRFGAVVVLTLFVAAVEFLCYLIGRVPVPRLLKVIVVIALYAGIPLFGLMIKVKFGWDSTLVFIIMIALLVIQLTVLFSSAGGEKAKLKWGTLWWELLVILGFIAPGFFFRLEDGYDSTNGVVSKHLLCFDDPSFQAFQPHAHWHLLGAIGLLLSYDLIAQFHHSNSAASPDQTVVFPDKSATGT